ncbi:MAG: hypothetical protein JJU01_05170 [Alkalibacterium sp.]|nr:hypothetical protein [Alkalibacterium sp.]
MQHTIYDKIFKPKTYTLSNGKEVKQRASRVPLVLLIVLFITIVSWEVTNVDLSLLRTRGYQFIVILTDLFPPNWNFLSNIWGPLFDTIQMSLLGSIAGAILAIPFALLSSSNISRNRV